MIAPCLGLDYYVIHIVIHVCMLHIMEDGLHSPLLFLIVVKVLIVQERKDNYRVYP